jgi:hypothetical protein
LIDIFNFGFEEERRRRKLRAEGIDEGWRGLFDGGNGMRRPEKIEESCKRLT